MARGMITARVRLRVNAWVRLKVRLAFISD